MRVCACELGHVVLVRALWCLLYSVYRALCSLCVLCESCKCCHLNGVLRNMRTTPYQLCRAKEQWAALVSCRHVASANPAKPACSPIYKSHVCNACLQSYLQIPSVHRLNVTSLQVVPGLPGDTGHLTDHHCLPMEYLLFHTSEVIAFADWV